MPDGRIDTRFPRLRFPRHDTRLRSTVLHLVHRTGMVCARTFSSLDSPRQFRFFRSIHFLCKHRLLIACMQISKRPLAMAQRFPPCMVASRGSQCPQSDSRVSIWTVSILHLDRDFAEHICEMARRRRDADVYRNEVSTE